MTETCRHEPMPGTGGSRRGPSLASTAYQLVMNGDDALFRAHVDVITWPDRVHRAALALGGAR